MAATETGLKLVLALDLETLINNVGSGWCLEKYPRNQTIFSQCEAADSVFYILKGKVKFAVLASLGKKAVVAILSADDFVGEECVDGQQIRTATAIALTDSPVARVQKAVFRNLIRREPDFSDMFIKHVLNRSIRVQADLADQLFNASEKRLARLLLLLANFGADGEPKPISAKIKQETLAEMNGTTRSRANFFMNKFRSLGLVDYGRGGEMAGHKSLLNLVLHEMPHIETEAHEVGGARSSRPD